MATTATALSDQQLEAELRQLQTDSATVRKKLDDETRKIEAARAERQRIVDGIGRGTVREVEAPRIKAEIEQIEIRIEGLNSLHTGKRSSMNALQLELGRRQAAAWKTAHAKEFAELNEEGIARATKILELLTRLETEDLPAFDAIRRKLGEDFRDLDGETAAVRLREMLWKAPGPRDALHDPNVHLRLLFNQGWELAGAPGPSYQSFRGVGGEFQSVPGGELSLTVCSLRSKK